LKKGSLEEGMKDHGKLELQLYTFFNLSARWRLVFKATSRPFYAWESDLAPIA
jgi:hypothetical protein